jgi:hypothetical protein
MALKLGRRMVRVMNNALLKRDRAEMRAVDALLAVIEPPRRRRTQTRRRRATTRRRR